MYNVNVSYIEFASTQAYTHIDKLFEARWKITDLENDFRETHSSKSVCTNTCAFNLPFIYWTSKTIRSSVGRRNFSSQSIRSKTFHRSSCFEALASREHTGAPRIPRGVWSLMDFTARYIVCRSKREYCARRSISHL